MSKAPNAQAAKWLKNKSKLGPFYLYGKQPHPSFPNRTQYLLIWNDKRSGKTKAGAVHDGMHTRYGFDTWCTLNGDTPFDTWGQPSGELFDAMLAVRKNDSQLPVFDLYSLEDVTS